jgi:hypothetical protein
VSSDAGVRILFIGNSLTGYNDLPRLVQAMAAAGKVGIQVAAENRGGFSLEDHWQAQSAQKLLTGSRWDYVVFQQGPSSLPESQVNLREWAGRWADLARKHGAKPALYMVWPHRGQKNGFAQVSLSYRNAAKASQSLILPAGEAWQEALQLDPALALYQEDRLHPTAAGSYLAALIITRGLTGVEPRSVPAELKLSTGHKFRMPASQVEILRRAAEKVSFEPAATGSSVPNK